VGCYKAVIAVMYSTMCAIVDVCVIACVAYTSSYKFVNTV
jgi:hypothetical protein